MTGSSVTSTIVDTISYRFASVDTVYALEVSDETSGASLSLALHGPGAGNIVIRDTVVEAATGSLVALRAVDIELSPSIQRELVGAQLSIPVGDAVPVGAGAALYHFDSTSGTWEKVGGSSYDAQTRTVSAPVTHSSVYSVFAQGVAAVLPAANAAPRVDGLRLIGNDLELGLASPGSIVIELLDLRGRVIGRMRPGPLGAGMHRIALGSAVQSTKALVVRVRGDGRALHIPLRHVR
ncbi:MAG: hypothetical protein GF331_13475 [Chitinivibrionales bacterium]|nr:hypothetical protein [Chitinivibrionales bacterium]